MACCRSREIGVISRGDSYLFVFSVSSVAARLFLYSAIWLRMVRSQRVFEVAWFSTRDITVACTRSIWAEKRCGKAVKKALLLPLSGSGHPEASMHHGFEKSCFINIRLRGCSFDQLSCWRCPPVFEAIDPAIAAWPRARGHGAAAPYPSGPRQMSAGMSDLT